MLWHGHRLVASPVDVRGLPPGPRMILIELADANYTPLA
jgi:hypothetical protein